MQVYHLHGPAPYYTNSFLVVTDAGNAIAVDPAPGVEQIESVLKEKNATLTHILLTHGHHDHVCSVEALQEKWNCKVYLDSADASGLELQPLRGTYEQYEDGGVIQVDEATFTTWHTPGHTEGSWLIECGGLLFAGDTLFAGSVGRTDLPGGDPKKQRETIQKIKNLPLPNDTTVLPGHGEFTTLGQEKETNPYFFM